MRIRKAAESFVVEDATAASDSPVRVGLRISM
jgi:hypothetical protein